VRMDPSTAVAARVAKELVEKFLPGRKVLLSRLSSTEPNSFGAASAVVSSLSSGHLIGLKATTKTKAVMDVVHEIGHAIGHDFLDKVPPDLLRRMDLEFREFIKELRAGNPDARFRRFSEGSNSVLDSRGRLKTSPLEDTSYAASWDEYLAEAFTRYIQKGTRNGGPAALEDAQARTLLAQLWEKIKELWEAARERGAYSQDDAFFEFFDSVLDGTLRAKVGKGDAPGYLAEELLVPSSATRSVDTVEAATRAAAQDPIAVKYGLNAMPQGTTTERAAYKAALALYTKASDPTAPWNNLNADALKSLTDNKVFNVASTSLIMLKSKNPVVRMLASELVESPSGAAGRRTTAAIAKYQHERRYMGNALNEVQMEYTSWRNARNGDAVGDIWDGKNWQTFNREVAMEIEARRAGNTGVESAPQVKAAADRLEAAYERMRVGQIAAKTPGWGALPDSSVGYMPHRLSPEKVMSITPAQETAFRQALSEQFQQIEGFDSTFSTTLAARYMDRVKSRAIGGHDSPGNTNAAGAADMVEDALEAMGMTAEEILAMRQKFTRGAAGHTKQRLKLDLNAEHVGDDGVTFRLLDLYDTDQFSLLRGQAGRVSGDTALAAHGVLGKAGLKLLRGSLRHGAADGKATAKEIEAFDQVAAELMSEPFGTASGKWIDRAMTVNSLARLGGMGITQFAEYINAAFHVGVGRTLSAIGGIPRLRAEAKALARGEKVDNSLLESLEQVGGAEFGTDSYKLVFPFDNGSLAYQGYGSDSVGFADRALRGASHLQGKLSMWRALHSAQQRGLAEQAVRKAVRYMKEGGNDLAMEQMGISSDLLARLRKDLPEMAEFSGRDVTSFDLTKAKDTQAAAEFVQAIHRGVNQMIQGTFVGEQGKWAHSGLLKLLTQFRTFSITSIEKQWARQAGARGAGTATMMLLGSMSVAAPIYMARVALNAQGREDAQEYLEKNLSIAQITRASLNYVALSGLSGDMLDALTAVSGVGTATGGRTGASRGFVGNVVAPSLGLVDDVWRGIQNTKEGTDPSELIKALPFSKLPFLIPAVNSLTD
jgi:hypothetical protein